MSNSDSYGKKASSPNHPEVDSVGDHAVIDKAEWVPGQHPDPSHRIEGQTEYKETYLRCVKCGVEVLRRGDLPETCEPEGKR